MPMDRRGARIAWLLASVCVLLVLLAGCQPEPAKRVILVGGPASEGLGRHAYPAGIRALEALLEASPDTHGRIEVAAYPDGWPSDPRAFDGAAAVVLYFDGLDKHPLRDARHRASFDALMRRGVGVVALHQASTVPPGDGLGLPRWLGGARVGTFDRTTEWAQLVPVMPAHPVARGLAPFEYRDEFYPTFHFAHAFDSGAARLRSGRTVEEGVARPRPDRTAEEETARPHPSRTVEEESVRPERREAESKRSPGAAGTHAPVLRATLHPQFRGGRELVEDVAETVDVAWAFERTGGGRSVVYSGTHYLAALDEPGVRRLLLNAVLWTAGLGVPEEGARVPELPRAAAVDAKAEAPASTPTRATFHVDPARTGWRSDEKVLTPQAVGAKDFGLVWESPQLDSFEGQPPRLYATPLHVERVAITGGSHRGVSFPVVFAATSNGDVYAINAAKRGDVAPGRILWRTHLGEPCRLQPAPLDGVPTGILGTPVIDLVRARLYVTHCDPQQHWQAYALDLGSGALLPGWPVRLDEASFNAINRNAGPQPVPPKRKFDFRVQRGALNLSPDGNLLYVVFGETETGWLVAVDTQAAKLRSAFAAAAMPHRGSGGIWGAGGPAVDAEGNVYVATGSGFDGYKDQPHDWTQSVLKLSMDSQGFVLRGTYTPFNHCQTAKNDIDLGAGGAMLPPDLPGPHPTPRLLAVGGKQGNVYLLDRTKLPGRLDRRPPCSADASTDASLLAPGPQPQFGTRGPLGVFGPYSEKDAALDLARARSVPAAFRDARGATYLYVTGNSKRAEGSAESVAPSVARLRIEAPSGRPAYLRIDRANPRLVLGNPGSPVVTSDGPRGPLVWVLDENAPRSALLAGTDAPRPVLYALDGVTLEVLWRSAPGELATSGKYNEPVFGGGLVFVGTDRIQAFGPGGTRQAGRHAPKLADASRPPAMRASDVAGLDSKTIYERRCAMCHDHPQGNIPPRARIATLPRERIAAALATGVMRVQARGLAPEQIDELARYLRQ